MAVTLDRSSTHATAILRGQSETSQSLKSLTNNSCHKEPVTLPPKEKCFEAAAERRASSLQPVQRWMQQQSSEHRGSKTDLSEGNTPFRWSLVAQKGAGNGHMSYFLGENSSLFIKRRSRWEDEMKRWDEVSPFCVSRNTYSVCLTLSCYRSTPSLSPTSNIPLNTYLYLTFESVWVNATHSCFAEV